MISRLVSLMESIRLRRERLSSSAPTIDSPMMTTLPQSRASPTTAAIRVRSRVSLPTSR